MKTCVTGGAGFIGSALVDRLVELGHEVTVLDNLSTGSRDNLSRSAGKVRFLEGDIRDRAAVDETVRGAEVVYHQAALAAVARSVENPGEVTEVNVGGTLHVLLGARDARARRVVFASSSSVYGDTPTLPKTETMPLTPLSPYAASKAAGEAYVSAFQGSYGLEGVSLRYFNVYGERQSPRSRYAAVVPRFIEAMAAGKPPVIYGDGQQTRDFTYVGDVVDALVRAATAPEAGRGPINVGGGLRISVASLAAIVAEAVGFHGGVAHEASRVGDVRDSRADIRRAQAWLSWWPRTSLKEGVARIVSGTCVVSPARAR